MSNVWYFSYFCIKVSIKLVIILILIILHACNRRKEMQVVCSLLATAAYCVLVEITDCYFFSFSRSSKRRQTTITTTTTTTTTITITIWRRWSTCRRKCFKRPKSLSEIPTGRTIPITCQRTRRGDPPSSNQKIWL